MGAWGPGVFENDAAEDLLDRLSSVDSRERYGILKDALLLPGVSSKFLVGQINPAELLAGVAVVAVNISEGDPFSGEEDYPSMRLWLDGVVGVELQSISVQALRCIEHEFDWY